MSPMMSEVCYNISAILIVLCLIYYMYNMLMSHHTSKKIQELKELMIAAQVDKLLEEADKRFGNPDIIDVDFEEGKVKGYRSKKEMILDELSRQKLAPGTASRLWKRARQID